MAKKKQTVEAIEMGTYTKKIATRNSNGKFTLKNAKTVRTGMVISKSYADQENANDNGVFFVEEGQKAEKND